MGVFFSSKYGISPQTKIPHTATSAAAEMCADKKHYERATIMQDSFEQDKKYLNRFSKTCTGTPFPKPAKGSVRVVPGHGELSAEEEDLIERFVKHLLAEERCEHTTSGKLDESEKSSS